MPSAGDFTATQLAALTLRAQQMWTTDLSRSPAPNTPTVQAVLANQTANVDTMTQKDKDQSMVITWVNGCAVDADDCTPDCSISGDELSSDTATYAPDLCKESAFSVNEYKFRTNTLQFEEVVATGLNRAINALDEWWNTQMLTRLKSFAGVNGVPAPWTYASTTTTIPGASYNRDAIATILYQIMMNGFTNPYMINNGDLWIEFQNIMFDAGNLDGKGDLARKNALPKIVFDLLGFSKAGLTDSLFVVNPDAVAMGTQSRNPQRPTKPKDVTLYTVPSRTLPGVVYDVFYEIRCEVINGESQYVDNWKVKTRGGIWKNPAGCPMTVGGTTFTPTGVISYTKGA
jgi:hypothetical protein